jgi:hypothetical protein
MKRIILLAITALWAVSSYSQSGEDKGVFDNAVYGRIGLGFPGGELGSNEVVTAAAQFEVGTIFYFSSLKIADNMKLGIDITYLIISGLANSPDLINDNKSDSYFLAGIKAGPCFSYNFTGKLIADVYFKLYPHLFRSGETQYHAYNGEDQTKLGTSFGLNVRYRALMVGFEYTSAKYDFVVGYPDGSALYDYSESIKIPIPYFSLGVKF